LCLSFPKVVLLRGRAPSFFFFVLRRLSNSPSTPCSFSLFTQPYMTPMVRWGRYRTFVQFLGWLVLGFGPPLSPLFVVHPSVVDGV